MGRKDRAASHKENIRCDILSAALTIGKESGWNSVSMRKIAEVVEYTAPAIYEYFDSKDDLLGELARQGFVILAEKIKEASLASENPHSQLLAMWMAYWDFAFTEQQRYQIMFGVEITCSMLKKEQGGSQILNALFLEVIGWILNEGDTSCDLVQKKFFTIWSVVHGLISIKMTQQNVPQHISEQIISEAVSAIQIC